MTKLLTASKPVSSKGSRKSAGKADQAKLPAGTPASPLPSISVVSPPNSTLASRAMLVTLKITQWAATRTDKKVTAEVHANHSVDQSVDAGKFRKQLLGKDCLKEIQRVVGFARNEHYARTLPWSQEGPRILSVKGYVDYMDRMQGYRKEFEALKPAFAAQFPQLVAQRSIEMGSLFNPNDYPDASKISEMFTFKLHVFPLPIGADFRADLDQAQADQIRADIEAQTNAAVGQTVSFVYEKLAKLIAHMAESLTNYKPSQKLDDGRETKPSGIFRNSLVENIREVCQLMPTLNITGNPELDAVTAKVIADLCQYDAEDLRESDGIRLKTAEKAEAILSEITGFLA